MRFLAVALLFGLSACSANSMHPFQEVVAQPEIAAETEIQQTLKKLPAAQTRIVAAVYNFTDKTGQHKPGETAQYSKAVTQGAEEILKKALLDASDHGWFRVVERQGLDSLLQERKIISSTRQTFAQDDNSLDTVGPLLYSGMLLEGGIVSYDSNVVTGGAGARYLGIGANSEYRRDVVTVYLSGVSVKTGEVVTSVSTSKTILSTSLTGGMYKFVSFDELLEAEAGFSVNEPPQFAVRQAIEMAVYSLIMEGYEKGLWKFSNKEAGTAAFLEYAKRRDGSVSAELKDKAYKLAASSKKQFAKANSEQEIVAAAPRTGQAQYQVQAADAVQKQTVAFTAGQYAAPVVPASYRPAQTSEQAQYDTQQGHYLQVAVFPRAAASKQLVGQIAAAGYPVYVKERKTGFGETFTVMVGPFESEGAMQGSIAQLSSLVNEAELN